MSGVSERGLLILSTIRDEHRLPRWAGREAETLQRVINSGHLERTGEGLKRKYKITAKGFEALATEAEEDNAVHADHD
jgi:hypothetical protein